LIKTAAEILPKEKTHILIILEDFFNQMKQPSNLFVYYHFENFLVKFTHSQLTSPDEFLRLFHPFLNAAFSFYSENCSPVIFTSSFLSLI